MLYAETLKLLTAKYYLGVHRISYVKYPTLSCNITMQNSLSRSYTVYLFLRFDFKYSKVRIILQKAEISGHSEGDLNLKSINENDYKILKADIDDFFKEYKNSINNVLIKKW